jgi:GT2 family glycosyltransferase
MYCKQPLSFYESEKSKKFPSAKMEKIAKPPPKSISVVIPSYNGKELLEKNLPFLLTALKNSGAQYEIIVVDDASQDDTLPFLGAHYPAIKALRNTQNMGFAPTINKGIYAASLDLVFLLNNDVQLCADYFLPLFSYFENPTVFGVMGKIIGLTDFEVQDAAKYPAYNGLSISGARNFEIEGAPPPVPIPSFMLSGANALVEREKLLTLGGFNEIFAPFYWEDLDLSLRAWRLGWRCYYCPEAVCRHPASTTVKKHFQQKETRKVAERNKMLLHVIHLEKYWLAVYWVKIFLKLIGKILTFQWQEAAIWQDFIAKTPLAYKERKALMQLGLERGGLLGLERIRQTILRDIQPFRYRIF